MSRYLVTPLQASYPRYVRVSRHTIASFLPEVCQAIIDHYKDEVIQCPQTKQEWRSLSWDFQDEWNLPHDLRALDGKHVAIRKPPSSGSLYHNYKGFFSIVLFGLVDAKYRFLKLDVGGMRHMSDAQIFNASELKECIEDGSINFPRPVPLPYDDVDTPYFLLRDDAFAVRKYLMKPYSRRGLTDDELVFNYRISSARRVVENAFGILANLWQFLLTTLHQGPDVVRRMVEAAVCLHSILRMRYTAIQDSLFDREEEHHNIIHGQRRETVNMHDLANVVRPNRDTIEAKKQREYLKLYFNSEVGKVACQPYIIRQIQV
ncbi:putative nuclease HARBI1 [Haliotis rubra]|uniref:putative nuclease HARBI1 n=1 Tax=Haliotis rubra TaxID=36100 RepID=UPI001EE57D07|nr:putative nuclease HARBI1 [Haliotis rubra]